MADLECGAERPVGGWWDRTVFVEAELDDIEELVGVRNREHFSLDKRVEAPNDRAPQRGADQEACLLGAESPLAARHAVDFVTQPDVRGEFIAQPFEDVVSEKVGNAFVEPVEPCVALSASAY